MDVSGKTFQLGISAFVGEISSGVAAAVFNGVSQGAQPLLSDYYGKGEHTSVKKVVGLGVGTSLWKKCILE